MLPAELVGFFRLCVCHKTYSCVTVCVAGAASWVYSFTVRSMKELLYLRPNIYHMCTRSLFLVPSQDPLKGLDSERGNFNLFDLIYLFYLRKFELFWGPVVEEERERIP